MSEHTFSGNWTSYIDDIDAACTSTTKHNVMYQMAQQQLKEDGEGYSLSDELDWLSECNIYVIHRPLERLLEKWYGDFDTLMENVRGATLEDDRLFFFTGNGYDTFDKDLLGGTGDGRTKEQFENFVHELELAEISER